MSEASNNGGSETSNSGEGEVVGATLGKPYTPPEAGKLLGFSGMSVRRMCERGQFPGALKSGAGGHWKIPREDVDDFLAQARAVHRRRKRRA